jgi:hypothetical protein
MLITEEAGHVDRQIGRERLDLLRVIAQSLDVVPEAVHPVQAHAAMNAAEQRAPLVAVEIPLALGADERQQHSQLFLGRDLLDRSRRLAHGRVAGEPEQRFGHPVRR